MPRPVLYSRPASLPTYPERVLIALCRVGQRLIGWVREWAKGEAEYVLLAVILGIFVAVCMRAVLKVVGQ